MRMQTCRRTELLQMLGVTTIGSHSHVGSQALGEDRHCLVDVFLWHLFPNGLHSDCQLISFLMLRLEFMVLFQYGAPDVTVQWVQIWRAWGPLSLLNEPVCIQSVLHDGCTQRKGGLSWLKQHNFVIFRYISSKLGDKVYIWLLNSYVKFHAKIFTHGSNINKSRRGILFYVHPVFVENQDWGVLGVQEESLNFLLIYVWSGAIWSQISHDMSIKQVAQLSQRDRAAVWSVVAKIW